jgi:hypothetical protein
MNLRVKNLKNVVQRVVEEEKVLLTLKEEITNKIGSSVVVENRDVGAICDDVMEHLDILEAKNGKVNSFRPALTVKMLEHASPHVRRLGARLAPVSQLHKVMSDKNSYVRCEVAKRVSLTELKKMMRQFPNDDGIAYIYEVRSSDNSDEFDMYGDSRLGDLTKQYNEQELTDMWYESLARKIVGQYKHYAEASWVPTAVNNYVRASKATSGIEVDPERLREAIYEIIDEHDEIVLSQKSLKTLYNRLVSDDLLESTMYTMGLDEDGDVVADLVNSQSRSLDYLKQANQVFSIKEGALSKGVRRHLILCEGLSGDVSVPVYGELPHSMGIRSIDEKALDLFCESWNKKRLLEGSPLRLSWSLDSSMETGIIFETKVF